MLIPSRAAFVNDTKRRNFRNVPWALTVCTKRTALLLLGLPLVQSCLTLQIAAETSCHRPKDDIAMLKAQLTPSALPRPGFLHEQSLARDGCSKHHHTQGVKTPTRYRTKTITQSSGHVLLSNRRLHEHCSSIRLPRPFQRSQCSSVRGRRPTPTPLSPHQVWRSPLLPSQRRPTRV